MLFEVIMGLKLAVVDKKINLCFRFSITGDLCLNTSYINRIGDCRGPRWFIEPREQGYGTNKLAFRLSPA